MAELVNLRMARKRAKQRQDAARVDANRLMHGRPKDLRKLDDARERKTGRDLDAHRIEKGDSR